MSDGFLKEYRGLFCGPLVIQTFTAHFIAMSGASKVPALGDAKSPKRFPYGALGLSAASVSFPSTRLPNNDIGK